MREVDLATHYGLGRKVLREIRRDELTEGVHWEMIDSAVTYRAVGIEKLAELVGKLGAEKAPPALVAGDGAADEESPPCPARAASAPILESLRVTRVSKLNPRLLYADHAGTEVRVRVRSTRFFVPGMVAKCLEESPGLWVLAQRLPRTRGRW